MSTLFPAHRHRRHSVLILRTSNTQGGELLMYTWRNRTVFCKRSQSGLFLTLPFFHLFSMKPLALFVRLLNEHWFVASQKCSILENNMRQIYRIVDVHRCKDQTWSHFRLQSDQNILFKSHLCCSKAAPLYVPTCWNLPHNRKRPKHTFHLKKRSLVSAAAVSQHACFHGFMPPFGVPLLLFTTSLSDEVLLTVKPDIVTVRSRMFFTRWVAGRVHISFDCS